MNNKLKPTFKLDLLGTACPMNFIKTKLFIDKMTTGQVVAVTLDPGEPFESVAESIQAEGHEILAKVQDPARYCCLYIRKV